MGAARSTYPVYTASWALALSIGNLSNQANRATQTAISAAAAVQETNEANSAAGTATALALANDNQATKDATTATAVWLNGDDDKDGLSNAKEIEMNLLPDQRDTDQDGLDDGEEVNNRNTDPLKPDTDGDGLKDGDEVSRGIDPLKTDTDGDGVPDAQDEAPGQPPTDTPAPSSTPTSTITPTSPTPQSKCPAPNADTRMYESQLVCFLYPADPGYKATEGTAKVKVEGPASDTGVEPVIPYYTIELHPELAAGRTSTDIAIDWINEFGMGGLSLEVGTVYLGGEIATTVDGVPGIATSRYVWVVHNNRIYSIFLYPTDMGVVQASIDLMWELLVESSRFK